jgi:hypothetical protein
VAHCHCLVMLAMALLKYLGHGVMLLPSYDGDGAVKATRPWRDVVAKSCLR